MRRYGMRHRLLAYGLALLAGFVDALGFLQLGGLFVSFMSGNSTQLAVGLAGGMPASALAAAVIAMFVGGVMAGTFIGRLAGGWRKQWVLGFVTLILTIAATTVPLGRSAFLAPLLMACAMGSANTIFQRDGEVSVGVTYMTGTLVKFSQHLATAIAGGPRFAWVPYLLLWLGLVAGAMLGAVSFHAHGLEALWISAAGAAILLASATSLGPTREE
ncbi:YoaK family protein [Sphingomonas sp.]|uniref:YoaK family protein n=1 Tax=Sphingomonas sp. TaxID=28214 RepID=UPI003B3BDDB3